MLWLHCKRVACALHACAQHGLPALCVCAWSPSNGGNSVKWTNTSHHHMLFPMPLLHALCTDGKPSPTGSP